MKDQEYRLTERGRQLVEALPDREKVKRLKAKWAREDRKKREGRKRGG